MRLTDGALELRSPTEADAPAIARACQDPEIKRWLPQMPSPYTEADALAYVRGEAVPGELSLVVVVDGALVGAIGLRRPGAGIGELGYWCAADRRGEGWTTRAVRLLARHAFDQLEVERLQLVAEPGNAASRRVAVKAGFTPEGILRAYIRHRDGRRTDAVMFSRLPGDPVDPI